MDLRKPLFLHCRDAADRFIGILQEHQLTAPAVAHCFTGSQEELQRFLDLGLYIGITGWVRAHKVMSYTLCQGAQGESWLSYNNNLLAVSAVVMADASSCWYVRCAMTGLSAVAES